MRIATSRYSNPLLKTQTDWLPVRITAGAPRWPLGYKLAGSVDVLAPTRKMLAERKAGGTWEAFQAEMRAQLDRAGLDRILGELTAIAPNGGPPRDVVLLCYEDVRIPGQRCHRRLVADWLEAQTGVPVPELDDPSPVKDDAIAKLKRERTRDTQQPALFSLLGGLPA